MRPGPEGRQRRAHLHDDEFAGQVVCVAQLFSETQRDAALRGLAAVGVEVFQLCSERAEEE